MSASPTMSRVLDALTEHHTNPAAAKALDMALPTLQTHVRRAYYFLGMTPGTPGRHDAARAELLRRWEAFRASDV